MPHELLAAEAREPFRDMIRADPLIAALMHAMKTKHQSCPVLDLPTQDGMRVMKEVEPFFDSTPQVAALEIDVTCTTGVEATVHAGYDDQVGGVQSMAKRLRTIEFHYDEFIPYLSRWPSGVTTPREQILVDPVVTEIHPVLAQAQEKCADLASGKLTVAQTPQFFDGGWSGRRFSYLSFGLAFFCADGWYQFNGKFFTDSGFVTWDSISVSHVVQ